MLTPEFLFSCQMDAERDLIIAMGRKEPYRYREGDRWYGEGGGWFPMWTRDYAEAFKLMVKYDLSVIVTDKAIYVDSINEGIYVPHFENKEQATCFAIVKGVTKKTARIEK